jgi:hypothetical protein
MIFHKHSDRWQQDTKILSPPQSQLDVPKSHGVAVQVVMDARLPPIFAAFEPRRNTSSRVIVVRIKA